MRHHFIYRTITFFGLTLSSALANAEMDLGTQLALITNPVARAMAKASGDKAAERRISEQIREYGRIDENKPDWILVGTSAPTGTSFYIDRTVWVQEKEEPAKIFAWSREEENDKPVYEKLLEVNCKNINRADTTGSVQLHFKAKEDKKPFRAAKVRNDFKDRFQNTSENTLLFVFNKKACSLKPLPAL